MTADFSRWEGEAPVRSMLFAPANRMDFIEKMPRWQADASVIDLEDGTPHDAKVAARATAADGVGRLRAAGLLGQIWVRVNAPASAWFEDDLQAAARMGIDGIVIPKVEDLATLARAEAILSDSEESRPVRPARLIAGLETAWGVHRAVEIAQTGERVAAIYFGAEDFASDIGARRTAEGLEVLYARSQIVLAARLAGIAAIDQVVLEIRDPARFLEDAGVGRQLGYTGKMCVHPSQVELAHHVFTPSSEEADWSRRLLRAYEAAERAGRGTIDFEGQMVDAPLLKRARAILAAYEAAGGAKT